MPPGLFSRPSLKPQALIPTERVGPTAGIALPPQLRKPGTRPLQAWSAVMIVMMNDCGQHGTRRMLPTHFPRVILWGYRCRHVVSVARLAQYSYVLHLGWQHGAMYRPSPCHGSGLLLPQLPGLGKTRRVKRRFVELCFFERRTLLQSIKMSFQECRAVAKPLF
jgi:hypothetical protein